MLFLSKVALVGVVEELLQGELFAVVVLGAFFRTNAEFLGNILVKLQVVAVEELQAVRIAIFGAVVNDLLLVFYTLANSNWSALVLTCQRCWLHAQHGMPTVDR